MYKTFLNTEELAADIENPNWVIVDTSYELNDKAAGYAYYQKAHIPGAVYAHPATDLSGPPITDVGRHPLPSPEQLIKVFSRLGISSSTQVVAYDNRGITAARLWWLLNYMGHDKVAVLDGGIKAWTDESRPTKSGIETNSPATFTGQAKREMMVVRDEVLAQQLLVDSRDAARFRGEGAGPDGVAGHIAGAVNRHHKLSKDDDMKLREPETLRKEFAELLGDTPSDETTFYCGSGVSACYNLLALKHIGMQPGKLYVGSWSEWSQFDELPKVKGD